jgi:hypothetical protein
MPRGPRFPFVLWLILFVAVPSWAASDRVTFHKCAAQVGDVSRQAIDCDLDLEMSIRQGGQIVQSQRQGLIRQQVRELTVLRADGRAAIEARVRYDQSTVEVRAADAPAQTTPQPVTGKTYVVSRQPSGLSVTYPDGQIPPDVEREIVFANMETFGLPNPIALYFDGRQVEVGQQVQLPVELARELLGFSETVGNISDFQLRLLETRPLANGAEAAVFAITLVAEHPDATAVSMKLTGQLVMEVATCRTVAVTLKGPISATETRGPEGGQFQLNCAGTIRMAVEADYRAVRR